MTLILDLAVFQSIVQQLHAAYPEEGCGLLLGHWDEARDERRVKAAHAAENVWEPAHERRSHFSIAPESIARADRRAREQGWDIVGVYHSHPNHEPLPSPEDAATAWPEISYLILRVDGNDVPDSEAVIVASWVFSQISSSFQQEKHHVNSYA
jgi:proteasome lid subunit RPN8/RPN11